MMVIVVSATLAFLLDKFIIVNAKIPSASMEPTIMTGDRLIGNRLAYINSDPERGDVVIFLYPCVCHTDGTGIRSQPESSKPSCQKRLSALFSACCGFSYQAKAQSVPLSSR